MKSLKTLVAVSMAMSAVSVHGVEFEAPEHHKWACVGLSESNGIIKPLLMTFADKPEWNGHTYLPTSEDIAPGPFLQEFDDDLQDYLVPINTPEVNVAVHTDQQIKNAIIALATGMQSAISKHRDSDLEEFLHAFFCPEHGVLINGLETIDALIDQMTEEEEDDEPKVRIIDGTGGGLPPELLQALSQVFGNPTGLANILGKELA